MKKILQEFKQFAMRGNVVDGGRYHYRWCLWKDRIFYRSGSDHAGGRFTCRWRQLHGFKNHLEARRNGGRQGDLSGGLH